MRKKILIISQQNSILDDEVKYGTLRATIEVAEYLSNIKNHQVYIAGLSNRYLSATTIPNNKVQYLLAENERNLKEYISMIFDRVDILIQISRLDYISSVKANKYIVYHHNPCEISFFDHLDTKYIVNFSKVSIVCVSKFSRQQQLFFGINNNLINVVPNGYDSSIFKPKKIVGRDLHSLVFAGHIVGYKGVDIALKAFAKIKTFFPDAIFYVCGANMSWTNIEDHYFEPNWLDEKGFPIWSRIEIEVSGVQYCGELSQTDLAIKFSQSSLLITPSRIPETFGLVSLEAQACGCIPLLPDMGGFPETLKNCLTGYLYKENNPDAIASIVTSLWRQNLPATSQRLEAQEWVRDSFSWGKTGSSFWKHVKSQPENKRIFLIRTFPYFIFRCLQLLARINKKINKILSTRI